MFEGIVETNPSPGASRHPLPKGEGQNVLFSGIRGHAKQIELLTKAIERGKLAHAYTLAGPSGIGKKLIAKHLAYCLLEGRALSAEGGEKFLPDLIEIDGRDGIKIEQIREFIYKLSLKPYSAQYKVAIIDAAEAMTTEAANALLKSLEEPKDYTIIILITSNPNKLPKTIISRTQKITFGPIQALSAEVRGVREDFFDTFQSQNLVEKLLTAYEMAELETSEIKNILEIWLKNLEIGLLENASKPLAHKITEVANARRFLDQNVNSKLLLTNLMLNS